MLDKSIPYIDMVMRRDEGQPVPAHPLPDGYRYVFYKPGDERDWARIETSVLEFDCEMEALQYFQETFLPYGPELPRRCLFVESPAGEKIATATAWWDYIGTRRRPMVHWVAAKPACQGLGIGKALIGELIRLMTEIEGDGVFYLHTQTWSHRAVRLYEWAHFYITHEPNVLGCANDRSHEAAALIQKLREPAAGTKNDA